MVALPASSLATEGPPRRLVVLGASNLALSLPTVIAMAQAAFGSPLTVLATPGHGRSYGLSTQFLWRRLPSIVDCGLWDELARQATTPTAALLTDIGNDLAYEVPLEQIIRWIATCLERLEAVGARVVMTSLPMASLRRTPRYRYHVLRRPLFPRNRTPIGAMLDQAAELNSQIEHLGREGRSTVVELPGAWYGLDPIHIRRSMRQQAWASILAPLYHAASPGLMPVLTRRHRAELRRLRPHERMVFGRAQRHPQPSARWANGTTLSLY